ncbi:DUF4402 domain-containing protein [Persicimonas caeni]|uniref:DUF4402 domain-containing protein n=1 Tax=Persicimonas caeni TaxID=2292766 RepID=UPI00143DFEBF|nr:DUF4402 domain-containing protein [Persicimonas caeni]
MGLLACAIPASAAGPRFREVKELNFGKIVRPSHGTNTFTLHWRNGQVATGGSGDAVHLGGSSNGHFIIRGRPNRTVTISATIDNFGASGLTVRQAHVNGTTSTHTTMLSGNGTFLARVGGILVVYTTATPGVHQTDLNLTLNYE